MNTPLTEHFSLEEMIISPTAVNLGISEQFTPDDKVKQNLKYLCENILEPLRALTKGSPVIVTSGYRCPRVNAAIGGASNSQHMVGQAADINVAGWSVEQTYQFIKHSNLKYDQLIQEFGQWVHVSFTTDGANRKQAMRAVKENGQTIYIND